MHFGSSHLGLCPKVAKHFWIAYRKLKLFTMDCFCGAGIERLLGAGKALKDAKAAPVTFAEVLKVQSKWADAIANISKVHKEGGDYIKAAAEAAGELYAYGHSDVMFKPTKAAEYRFRPTAEEAMSYFVGGKAVAGGYAEDGGFAINGGKGWASCVYKNHLVQLKGVVGLAMGTYDFTCATTGSVSTVEYTFGYTRCNDGMVRIFLHHSSVPFAAPVTNPAAGKTSKPAAVTGAEVLEVQSKWAAAIANISKVHKEGGDYIKAAAEAAGELYAYGHSNVMFKPTKAAEYQFRPTAEEAMSYFVGGKAVAGGYAEDGGFAINGGKGWASCVYKNHQVQLKGGVGLAMGTYDFTCATTGSVSTVEYTFGYTRCSDGRVRIFLHHSSVPFAAAPASNPAPVTEAEVLKVQSKWADAIANISKVHKEGRDYIKAAAEAAGELYAYGHCDVMFKPTKAAEYRFRPTAEEAMSYFVGGNVVEGGYAEDGGFAINGGKGWASCVYKNHQVQLKGGVGLAMGTYDFTCATTGSVSTVEYTFGYTRCNDGKVRIFLHHSSVPFAAAPAPVTEAEVLKVQSKWADAIANISKVHKEGGDYIKAAAEAAGELYAYGHSDVMFKPTKAAEYRFRPTAEEAMSYFVGGNVVKGGYKEDGGFAINGGKGWASCVYKNHQVQLKGVVGLAMGTYDFTCATTGSVSTVEYTFGYTRCNDGMVRIFLHHSSVPFAAPAANSAASNGKTSKPAAVTGAEVLEVQSKWADAIANISKVHKEGGDYIKAAAEAAGELYAYGHSNVLFKPTKAAEYRFRPTAGEAMSYFVGGNVVEGGYKEDGGFAINGGKGWASCVYKNHQVTLKGGVGLAMGTYDFTCATTGSVSTVEYTFGYTRCSDGRVRIFLHHSSVPFAAAPASNPAPVTEAEVLKVQSKWADAIANISKVHKEGRDYIKAAAEAAGELYAYGHCDVMFKPTKAAEYKFRPTAEEAMSYFVGGNVVEGGYTEDGGFAINGGKGWASCVYKNHQVQLKGGVGLAMGTYDFTCATTGSVSTVEYTFGYTRCNDGMVRIFLHHSSVPFKAAK